MQPEPAYITSNGYKLMYQPKIDMAKARIREIGVELTDDNIVKFYAELGGWLIGPNGEKVDTLVRPFVLRENKKEEKEEKEEIVTEKTESVTDSEHSTYEEPKPKRGRPAKNNW